MTYREVLHNVSFDEIVPLISRFDNGKENLASYKMLYDYLCHLHPEEQADKDKATTIHMLPSNEKRPEILLFDEYPNMTVWQDSLTRDLLLEPDIKGTLAEIAAHCLWAASFYGFTEYQVEAGYHKSTGHYSQELYRFLKIYNHHIPTIKEMLTIRAFHDKIKREIKDHRSFHPRKMDKGWEPSYLRKRNWRYWKRKEIKKEYTSNIYLKGSFIENLLVHGQNLIEPPTMKELSVLFKSSHCQIERWQTYTYNAAKRYGYFRDLIEKYNLLPTISLPNSFICISTSEKFPLVIEELELVTLIVGKRTGSNLFCIKTDNTLGEELRIDAAFYTV
ncbi:hypothetical protein [Parabacteroides sp.]